MESHLAEVTIGRIAQHRTAIKGDLRGTGERHLNSHATLSIRLERQALN